MTISKRNLTKWRKEALKELEILKQKYRKDTIHPTYANDIVIQDRILLLTQELLDQHLLKEANNAT